MNGHDKDRIDLLVEMLKPNIEKTNKVYERVFEDNGDSLCSQVKMNRNDIEDIKEMFAQINTSMTATLENIRNSVPKNGKELKFGGIKTTTSQLWILWNRFLIAVITALLSYIGLTI